MSDDPPYDVFFSYARVDEVWARPLAEAIARASENRPGSPWKVFFDTEDVHGEDFWRPKLLREVERAHTFVAVLSPAYMRSYGAERMCFHEYETAAHRELQGEKGVLFQVVYQPAKFTSYMNRREYFDLSPVSAGQFESSRDSNAAERPTSSPSISPGTSPARSGSRPARPTWRASSCSSRRASSRWDRSKMTRRSRSTA